MPKPVDHTGKTFGRLTAIERIACRGQETRYRCSCECGETIVTQGSHLTGGGTRSCGCLRKETSIEIGHDNRTHGGYAQDSSPGKRQAIAALHSAKKRCYSEKDPRYSRYGGRGISICEEWLADFNQFHLDMGDPPAGYSLNRIDNDGNYNKDNCEWADVVTQANNKRNNIRIEFDGRTQTASEWAREIGMRPAAVRKRIKRGWSAEAVLTRSNQRNSHRLDYDLTVFGMSRITADLLGSEVIRDPGWRTKTGLAQLQR